MKKNHADEFCERPCSTFMGIKTDAGFFTLLPVNWEERNWAYIFVGMMQHVLGGHKTLMT